MLVVLSQINVSGQRADGNESSYRLQFQDTSPNTPDEWHNHGSNVSSRIKQTVA